MSQQIDFSLANNFNGVCRKESLLDTIHNDDQIEAVVHDVIIQGDLVRITFFPTLTASEEAYLRGTVVPAHDGNDLTPLINNKYESLENKTLVVPNNTISGITNTNIASNAGIEVAKIGSGNVDTNQFDFLSDVTSSIQGQLDAKAATIHGHSISDVSGLQNALNSKAQLIHGHGISQIAELEQELEGKAAFSHTHAISHITNLQSTLNGKAATSHTHTIANITNLQNELDGKASVSHVHTGRFAAYDSVGNLSIDSGFVPIPWNVETDPGTGYVVHTNATQIEFVVSGTVKVSADVSVGISGTSSSRTESSARLTLNTGSGFTEITGSKCYMYHRNSTQGRMTGTINHTFTVVPGHILRVEAVRSSGAAPLVTLANGSRINLEIY